MKEFNTKEIKREIKDYDSETGVMIKIVTISITKEQQLRIEEEFDLFWKNIKNTVSIQ